MSLARLLGHLDIEFRNISFPVILSSINRLWNLYLHHDDHDGKSD